MSLICAFKHLSLILPIQTDAHVLNEVSMQSYISKYVDESMSTDTDVVGETKLNTRSKKEKPSKMNRIYHRPLQRSTRIIKHGLSYISKPLVSNSTVRTGYCSKSPKSNELTRKSKDKQDLFRQQLQNQVRELESQQDDLLLQVQDLYLYKYKLEAKCQENNSSCRSSF